MAKISETINSMIQKILESAEWTSANPTHINTLIQVNAVENPDFEAEIEKLIDTKKEKKSAKKTDELKIDSKTRKKIDKNDEALSMFKGGNVGKLQGFTSEQFGNVSSFASDPFGFVVGNFLKKFKTGVGILFIVAVATQVAKFLINELHGVGRPLDTRFREIVDEQLIKFIDRKEQQELKQGFKSIITTTQGGLRGESLRGQIGGNFFTPGRIPDRNVQQAAEGRQPFDIATDPTVRIATDAITVALGPIAGTAVKAVLNYARRNPTSSDVRQKSRESMTPFQWRASFGGFGRR